MVRGSRPRAIALLASLALGSSALWFAPDAKAFCRTTTISVPADFIPTDGCFSEGNVLWWRTACVGYSIQSAASKQVTLAQGRAIDRHRVRAVDRNAVQRR